MKNVVLTVMGLIVSATAADPELTLLSGPFGKDQSGPLGVFTGVAGDTLYQLLQNDIITIWNVADKTNPLKVKDFPMATIPGPWRGMILDEAREKIYVRHEADITEVSIADPFNPKVERTLAFSGGCASRTPSFLQNGNNIFLTCHLGATKTRFMVISKTSFTEVEHIDVNYISFETFALIHQETTVYVKWDDFTMSTIDISGAVPSITSTFPVETGVQFAVEGDFIYTFVGGPFTTPTLKKFHAMTGVEEAPLDLPSAGGILFLSISAYNGKFYVTTEKAVTVMEETSPNTFKILETLPIDTTAAYTIIDREFLYVYTTENFIFGIIPAPIVEERAVQFSDVGATLVQQDVGVAKAVMDPVSEQKWVNIPEFLEDSKASLGAFAQASTEMKLTCTDAAAGCTFYIVLHNCMPCSSALNGGLPNALLGMGFPVGSCGPRYFPTFSGAPSESLPTVTFKVEIQAGGQDVVIPFSRKLLHVAVFEVAGVQSKPMCPTNAGPHRASGHVCACFKAPVF
eukprot:TRINITY_DN3875_c0_g3_i2.p1 TRINITY_DN3875_c0_g3~~TRINITY_DN3875_c0_g3_i2.p1  ORF type:complete len:515 (+),score=71.89 TRINITY_DN3875_c0_g3_i2:795-2339(+)